MIKEQSRRDLAFAQASCVPEIAYFHPFRKMSASSLTRPPFFVVVVILLLTEGPVIVSWSRSARERESACYLTNARIVASYRPCLTNHPLIEDGAVTRHVGQKHGMGWTATCGGVTATTGSRHDMLLGVCSWMMCVTWANEARSQWECWVGHRYGVVLGQADDGIWHQALGWRWMTKDIFRFCTMLTRSNYSASDPIVMR